MTQEDKELLLQDLCAKLPYGVKVLGDNKYISVVGSVSICPSYVYVRLSDISDKFISIEDCKPYLRPMSSVTEEEEKELIDHFCNHRYAQYFDVCNKYHIDYRGLIEKGLAIEAPKGMYKTE